MSELTIKLIGIFLGVLSRMIFPYLRKLHQGKIKKFEKKYISLTVVSLILSLIVTILIFPQIKIEQKGLNLFCISFGFGFGFHSIISEFRNWFKK